MKAAMWLCAILVLLPTSALAELQMEMNVKFENNDKSCRRDAYVAKILMWQRQHGVSFTDSLNWIDEQLKNDPELIQLNSPDLTSATKQLFNYMARDAYSRPIEMFEQDKQRVATDFELDTYRRCMDQLNYQ